MDLEAASNRHLAFDMVTTSNCTKKRNDNSRKTDTLKYGILLVTCLFTLFTSTACGLSSSTTSTDHDYCDVRYKLKSGVLTSNNCTHVDIPGCNETIKIAYKNYPPYVFEENGKVKGILVEYLDIVIHACCHGCGNFEFIGSLTDDELINYTDANIMMPIRTALSNNFYLQHHFAYLTKLPGVTFLREKDIVPPETLARKMMFAVLDTWPLFLIAIVLSVMSGVIIWCMEMCFNRLQFPISFPAGPFEGCWWAFISMTTVGYGDRAPISIIGRLFGMVWIFTGITILSMYSATLTSSMADALLNKQETLLGKKVAVLNETTEGRLAATKESSKVVEFGSIEAIIDALHSRSVEGVALDDNLASYYLLRMVESVPDLHFFKHSEMEGQVYGVAIPTEHVNMSHLINSFFSHNEDQRDLILSTITQKYQKVDHTSHIQEHIKIFSTESPLFSIALYACAGIILLGIGVGFVMIYVYDKRGCIQKVQDEEQIIESKQPDLHSWRHEKIEARFIMEMRKLCQKWRKEIQVTQSSTTFQSEYFSGVEYASLAFNGGSNNIDSGVQKK